MAKAVKKKDAKTASNTFHNIMAASVSGNPKPAQMDISTLFKHMESIENEIAKVVPDYKSYVVMQVGGVNELHYSINSRCPEDQANDIKRIILENAVRLGLNVNTSNHLAE